MGAMVGADGRRRRTRRKSTEIASEHEKERREKREGITETVMYNELPKREREEGEEKKEI